MVDKTLIRLAIFGGSRLTTHDESEAMNEFVVGVLKNIPKP